MLTQGNFANLGISCAIYASLLEGLAPPMVQAPWASKTLTGAGRDAMLAAMAASLAATACCTSGPEADDELTSRTIVLCALPFGAT